MKLSLLLGISMIIGQISLAAPPPGADMTMAPWFQSLKVPENGTPEAGGSCCDLADCRPVRYRTKGNHYEAFVDAQTFSADAPNAWVVVPDEVILKARDNPTGEGVLCWFHGVRCFVPASAS